MGSQRRQLTRRRWFCLAAGVGGPLLDARLGSVFGCGGNKERTWECGGELQCMQESILVNVRAVGTARLGVSALQVSNVVNVLSVILRRMPNNVNSSRWSRKRRANQICT